MNTDKQTNHDRAKLALPRIQIPGKLAERKASSGVMEATACGKTAAYDAASV